MIQTDTDSGTNTGIGISSDTTLQGTLQETLQVR